MFRPYNMKKVVVAGSADLLETTIDVLFELKLIHLKDFKKDVQDFNMGTPLKEAGPSSERLLKLRSAEKVLGVGPSSETQGAVPVKEVEDSLDGLIKDIDARIMTKWAAHSELDNRMRELDRRAEELMPFSDLPLKLEDLQPYENLAVIIGTVRTDPQQALADKLRGHGFEIFHAVHKEGRLLAIFVENGSENAAMEVLLAHGFNELKPPQGTGYPKAHIANLSTERKILESEHAELEKEIKGLSKEYATSLLSSEEHLRIKVEKAEAPLHFATTANAFVLEGFITEAGSQKLVEALSKATQDSLYIEITDPEKDEDIPVALKNPGPSQPFEVLTNLVARPRYDEIDPTILMFIGMPLFFGIMLGDIGYGIVILVCIALGVMTKVFKFLGMEGAAPQLNAILTLCAIWSLVFGFLYNEFFGFELMAHSGLSEEAVVVLPMVHYPEFTIPRILAFGPAEFPVVRFENVLPLLKLTVWMGLAHIFLGLIIGFRNKYVSHGIAHAVFEKGSWMLILLGGVIVFYFLLRDISGYEHLYYAQTAEIVGFIIIVVGCALLILGEGPMGLIHIPSMISNTMSYARILAIGLSSVGIALAFNNMAVSLWESGGAYMIGAALVFFSGHFINILLGILGPGLHSLRLHYVEFFNKFYEGGGTPYSPFGMTRRFTTTGPRPKPAPKTVDFEPNMNLRIS